MRADLIFASLTPEQAGAVFAEFREADRGSYRGAVAAVAGRKRLRAAFLDKKPLPERHAWMAAELARKPNADLAAEVLQGWLFACHKPMLRDFLAATGVPHDGDGLLESLPPEPPRQTFEAAIDALLASYPAWKVAAYLRIFSEMDMTAWPSFTDILEERFPSTFHP